jgi:hypothetical protein
LAKVLLKDLDERFHPDDDGRVQYLSNVTAGRYNRHITLHPYFFLAAFVDPRVRPLLPQMLTAQGLRELEKDLMDKMVVEFGLMKEEKKESSQKNTASTPIDVSHSPPLRATILFAGLDPVGDVIDVSEDLDAEEVMNEVKAELIIYKREGSMPMTTEDGKYSNPLGWWRKKAYKFPVLARLSRKLLAIPATSAPSERVIWSRVSSVLTMKRARMKSDVASDIMYIRENIDILRKYYVTIAVQERGEMERSMIELEKMFLPPIEESLDDVGK